MLQDQLPNVTTNVQSTSVFNSDVVGLSLQPSKYYITPSRQNTTNNIPVLSKPISDTISNILIACLNIDSWLLPSNSKYSTEPFSDECVCIDRLLSIINKRVYFIVPSSASEYIIPLVYQHQCIEQIYILSSEEIQQKTTLINGLPKVQGSWTDYNVLLSHLYRDIDSVFSQPLLWSNEELIHKYYTQCLIQLSNRPSILLDSSNLEKYSISNNHISIVVLHCDNYVLFDIESQHFQLSKFSNVDKCIEYLGITDISSVFFIISGEKNSITRDIRKITMLKRIYVIYLFVPVTDIEELTEPLLSYKNIGRLFDNLEFLFHCLTADIKFYLEQLFYIPKLSVFPLQSDTQVNIKTGFTKIQEEFVAFQLFVNSFGEAPTSISQNETLFDRCINLVKDKSNIENILQILKHETNEIFNWFIDDSFLFVCMNSFLQEEFPRNLLDIQQLLVTINQHFVGLTSTTSSTTVYRVQLLNEEKLKIIEANINELIVFHTYLLATKDLLNARTIARQAANRGLLVILFQIEYSTTENVLELDNGRSMFRFGTIFRIRSINLGADKVWYTQLDHADSDFQPIQERLQFQVGNRLTWLTLGKYLSVINHTTHAKCYYEHLLKNLPHDHQALPSIYNNIGLICAELGDHQSSLKYYNEALELLKKSSQNIDHVSEDSSFEALSQSVESEMTANDYLLHDTKDEAYCQHLQNEETLKCYRKALELETDPLIRFQHELKIKDILSSK